jgi:hypothetical protein
MTANVGAGAFACVGDAGANGVVGEAGDETAGVVAAGAFAGGVTIVGAGVVRAGDTGGSETMPNACSRRVRHSLASRCLLRVTNCAKMRLSLAKMVAGSMSRPAMDGDASVVVFDTNLIWIG